MTLFITVLDDHAAKAAISCARQSGPLHMTEEWRKAICYRNSIDVGKSLQNTEMTAIISYTRVIQVRKPINGVSGGMPAFFCIQKTPNKHYDIALKEKKSR